MDASGSIQGSEEQGGNALLEEGGSVLLLSVLGYAHGLFWPRLFIVPCFQFLNNLTAHLERFALQWGEWISRSFNSHHIFRKKTEIATLEREKKITHCHSIYFTQKEALKKAMILCAQGCSIWSLHPVTLWNDILFLFGFQATKIESSSGECTRI